VKSSNDIIENKTTGKHNTEAAGTTSHSDLSGVSSIGRFCRVFQISFVKVNVTGEIRTTNRSSNFWHILNLRNCLTGIISILAFVDDVSIWCVEVQCFTVFIKILACLITYILNYLITYLLTYLLTSFVSPSDNPTHMN